MECIYLAMQKIVDEDKNGEKNQKEYGIMIYEKTLFDILCSRERQERDRNGDIMRYRRR